MSCVFRTLQPASHTPALLTQLPVLPDLPVVWPAHEWAQPSHAAAQWIRVWRTCMYGTSGDGGQCIIVLEGSSLPRFYTLAACFWWWCRWRLICIMTVDVLYRYHLALVLTWFLSSSSSSSQALQERAQENDGTVTCLRTKETFKFSDVKKVFVMWRDHPEIMNDAILYRTAFYLLICLLNSHVLHPAIYIYRASYWHASDGDSGDHSLVRLE